VNPMQTQIEPDALVYRLQRATNAHDLEAVVGCFAPDYRNETPAHPERGFAAGTLLCNRQIRDAPGGRKVSAC
jgi:hypothetical protein